MSKRFKFKFNVPSFQICRSKDLSSFPGNPVPAIYRLSPVNHNARYPNLPSPSSSKITSSISQGCNMCRDKEPKKARSRSRKGTSSVPSRRSDFLMDSVEEEESETLISCLTSFSDEICHDEVRDLRNSRHRRKTSSVKKVQSVRFRSSSENRGGAGTTEKVKKASTTVTRSNVEGKVRESFAVVKKSKDPYEDFKKSMMEMITEMEMSEAEDLEQLLQCFLALNSRSYHAVIVRVFMEIWQQMFVWNPKSVKNLTDVKNDAEK
ncbi:transcription repressor OFP7-like [Vigna unguiculata]|uniref:Transcription repressor n=1 Tax=Vigna unguiculata TaxID=3917 RepID=A0A4D6NUF2_VIGUN|nr:transcription repressor OFP7-like [Vigna unguiculata]QCE16601.1 Ovate protein family [Vigna unguiculata]